MALSHGTVLAVSPRRVGLTYTVYLHRRCKNAQVRDRTRIAWRGEVVTARAASDLAEVVLGPRQAGAADPVGAELRDRRQDLLCLYRPRRSDGSRACSAGRLSGQPCLRGSNDDRPHDSGALIASSVAVWRSDARPPGSYTSGGAAPRTSRNQGGLRRRRNLRKTQRNSPQRASGKSLTSTRWVGQ